MRGIRELLAAILLAALAAAFGRSAYAQEAGDSLDLAAISPQRPYIAPRVAQQIAGARIGWERTNIRSTFKRAAAEGLPIVVVATGSDGDLFANVLRCPTFNTLAGQAYFILVPLPVVDETSDAARLMDVLHMDNVFKSTVAVLNLRDRGVVEVARISGYQGEADLLPKIRQAGLAPMRPNPLPLDSVALGPQLPRDCESSSIK